MITTCLPVAMIWSGTTSPATTRLDWRRYSIAKWVPARSAPGTSSRRGTRAPVASTTASYRAGIHFAMEYLRQSNRVVAGDVVPDQIMATGKHVVIIGAGDTGSDCLGTALRQGAASVTSLDIGAEPPVDRPANQPWPVDPLVFKVTSSHEEGGEREYLATTQEFLGDGHVSALRVATNEYTPEKRLVPVGAVRDIPADLVIPAMGFTGPETEVLTSQTGADVTGCLLYTS